MDLQYIFGDTTRTGELGIGHAQDPPNSDEENVEVANLEAEHDNQIQYTVVTEGDGGETHLRRADRTPTTLRKGKRHSSKFTEAYKALVECFRMHMASHNATSSATSHFPTANANPYSISKCMELLNNMEEIRDDDYTKTTKLCRILG